MGKEWSDIRPGDFIHLSCDEIIPADILLLSSSDPQGICHIETSNLDGETNLKQRHVVSGIDYGVSYYLLEYGIFFSTFVFVVIGRLYIIILNALFCKSVIHFVLPDKTA